MIIKRRKPMTSDDLIARLKLDLEWAEANEWEAPICLSDDLLEAIEYIKWADNIIKGI